MRLKKLFNQGLLICLAAVLLMPLTTGCGIFKSLFGDEGSEIEVLPDQLAQDGMEALDNENYRTAALIFRELKDRYPYSKYAILAELKMADSLYFKELYIEAAEAYREFERLHPKNEAIPYVIYQIGMCNFQQIQGPDRDQTPTVEAIQTFTRLRETFPDSRFASMALARITDAQNALAGHEWYVGQFYYKLNMYPAALGRFISLVKNYPDTGYHSQALEQIKACRQKIEEQNAATAAWEAEQKQKEEAEKPPEKKTGETGGEKAGKSE